MTKQDEAIISIRPQFAEAILNGSKTVELRRRIPPIDVGTRLWIYATRPIAAIIGSAKVDSIVRGTPDEVWAQFQNSAGVSRAKFDDYFEDTNEAIGLVLKDIYRANPIEIEQLRALRTGFHPPQVIARITQSEAESIGCLARAS